LRHALSRACASEIEVEVLAATQKIDVYSVPDPPVRPSALDWPARCPVGGTAPVRGRSIASIVIMRSDSQ
jgi:hypothetical protein